MAIKAVVFDIGGVLEYTPNLGIDARWEQALGLPAGELLRRMADVWRAGSIGAITLDDVHISMQKAMGWDSAQVEAYMADVWQEYVGTLNTELRDYFAGLRQKYKTGILSNSFVGAREREQALYGFEDIADVIVYSHEVGLKKPDPAIYALTCERLGLQPGEVLFLDNVPEAVEAARAAGMHGVLFVDNAQAITEIEALLAAE